MTKQGKENAIGISKEDQYIRRLLGECLTAALVEIVEQKPADPIEYLAQYLYIFRKNNPPENEISPINTEPRSDHRKTDLRILSEGVGGVDGREFVTEVVHSQLDVVHQELDSMFQQIDDIFDDDDFT